MNGNVEPLTKQKTWWYCSDTDVIRRLRDAQNPFSLCLFVCLFVSFAYLLHEVVTDECLYCLSDDYFWINYSYRVYLIYLYFYFFFNDLHQVNLGRPPFLFQVGVHFLLLVSTDSGGVFHQQRQSLLVKGILPKYLVLNLIQHAHMNCEIFHYYASYGWNSR